MMSQKRTVIEKMQLMYEVLLLIRVNLNVYKNFFDKELMLKNFSFELRAGYLNLRMQTWPIYQ